MEDPKARYISEFVGTFILVLTVGCNVLTGQKVWAGVSIGCALMVMVYALGKSSGANFNPAVSLSLGISKDLEWIEVGIYMVVQILAGILAGGIYSGLTGGKILLHPVGEHVFWQACLAEMIYTFMLCFVVLNVAGTKKSRENEFYGLAIGFVIVAGAYSGGSVSGGCFNPAVALGIEFSSFMWGGGYSFLYVPCEFIGAALAAGLHRICRPKKYDADATEGLPAKLLSEFLGTYMLVLTVGLNVLSHSPASVFSIAASLMCMIFALGDVSGAHFNPAVTVSILCSRRNMISPKHALAYMAMQVFGGISASATYIVMFSGKSFPLGPGTGYNLAQALLGEIIFTFVLAFVVLSVATVKKDLKEAFGLAIGACVTVGGYAIGKISGGSLNPAVSIGVASYGGGYGYCVAYVLAEIIGGTLAAGVFKVTQPSEYEEKLADQEKLIDKESTPYGATEQVPP